MTRQNNTYQSVLTDEEIRAVWVEHGLDDEAVEDFARAIESALLSKLRAPVADERAEMVARVDAAMVEMQNITPPLRRSECERLIRAALASAPVAGEAKPVIHQHGFAADNQRLRAINESQDKQLEEVMTERDEYHDMADKLANAIADHPLVEIGEHSSSNCPWMRALEAIENAAPQASEAVRTGYAGVKVWIGDLEATKIVPEIQLVSSKADELLRAFQGARVSIVVKQHKENVS